MIKLFDVKNNFLRRILSRLRPIGELVREKNEAVNHAEKAEISAWRAIKKEMKILQAENRKLRDQNLELIGSAQGKSLVSTAYWLSFIVCVFMLFFLCNPRSFHVSVID